ncbi:hypothetical protein SFUMM280S_07324 [Streptomyces fumanus]
MLPKTRQKPHPPMWMACGNREAIRLAAAKGLGALNFSFFGPAETRKWVDAYYEGIESAECVPAGFAVNAQVAATIPMFCHQDEATAVERRADGVQFFNFGLGFYAGFGAAAPGRTRLWETFQRDRDRYGMGRAAFGKPGMPLGNPARGAVGTPSRSGGSCASTRRPVSTRRSSWCRAAGPGTSTSASRWNCSPAR